MFASEQPTTHNLRHVADLSQSSGESFISQWVQSLPDPMAQHGIISEFTHHPTSMAKVESQGPFAGETKLDAWLFKHSKFLRSHFKNGMQHTDASGTVFQHGDKDGVRHRSDTTDSAESRTEPGAADSAEGPAQRLENEGRLERDESDEIQVGEEAPGHAVNAVRDVNMQKGAKLRRGSLKKGMKWAFWYNGDQ
jgi:hypothetical protein